MALEACAHEATFLDLKAVEGRFSGLSVLTFPYLKYAKVRLVSHFVRQPNLALFGRSIYSVAALRMNASI